MKSRRRRSLNVEDDWPSAAARGVDPMSKSETWNQKVERETRELQKLVYGGHAVPRQSAAKSLYPAHDSSFRQVEVARRNTAPQQTTQTAPNSIASLVYPHL